MSCIREGSSPCGKILGVLDGSCVKEGKNINGHILVTSDGKYIREGGSCSWNYAQGINLILL